MVLSPASPAHWIALYALAGLGLLALVASLVRLTRRWAAGPETVPPVSLLVMVRNQEHHIEAILRSLCQITSCQRLAGSDMVVVDYCSDDETPRIAERLAAELGRLRLVRLTEHVCRGRAACEVGLFACNSRVVVLVDLLGTTAPRPLVQAVASLVGVRGPLWWV